MVYRESDEQRERDLRRYMQIAEARSKAAAAREVASNIQNKNNQSVNYQVRNLADSTKAVMNMPLDPEYVQKSTASWDRDVATTAKIKEESPGLLSRIGTMYTDWTRPFVAPAYYATLKAREAITGDDTGVKEMERYFDLRRAKNRASSIFNPRRTLLWKLDKEESDVLAEAWSKNPLPWGVLGTMEVVIDPINVLPVGYITKAVGAIGKGAFKSGTQLLLNAGHRVGIPESAVSLQNSSVGSGVKEALYGTKPGIIDHLDEGTKSHSETLGSDINGYQPGGQKQALENKINGEPPNIVEGDIAGARSPETIIHPGDTIANIQMEQADTIKRFGGQLRGRYESDLEEIVEKSFKLDEYGGVYDIELDPDKAATVQAWLKGKVDELGKTKAGKASLDYRTWNYALKQVDDLVAKTGDQFTLTGRPHYSAIFEHFDIFKLQSGHLAFLNVFRNMQGQIIDLAKGVDDSDDLIRSVLYEVGTDTMDATGVETVLRGGFFPRIAREIIKPDGTYPTIYEPWKERYFTDIIEEGSIRGYNYEANPVRAVVDFYQGWTKYLAESIAFQKTIRHFADSTPDDLVRAIENTYEALGKELPKDFAKLIQTETVTGQVGDAVNENLKLLVKQAKSIDDITPAIEFIEGMKDLKLAGLLDEIKDITEITPGNIGAIKRKLDVVKKQLEKKIGPLQAFKRAITGKKEGVADDVLNHEPTRNFIEDLFSGRVISTDVIPRAEQIRIGRIGKAYLAAKGVAAYGTKQAKEGVTYTRTPVATDLPYFLRGAGVTETRRRAIQSPDELRKQFKDEILKYYNRHFNDDGGTLPALLARSRAITQVAKLSFSDPQKTIQDLVKQNKILKGDININTLMSKPLDINDPRSMEDYLKFVKTFLLEEKGRIKQLQRDANVAIKNRAKDAKLVNPVRVQLQDGSILKLDESLRDAIAEAPESKNTLFGPVGQSVGNFLLNVNRAFRLLGTAFDASQPVIQGLRLLTVPGGAKVWAEMYMGSIRDIVAGKTGSYTWYRNQAANVTSDEWASMTRAGIEFQEMAEFFELLTTKTWKSTSERVAKVLDKIPGDMTQPGSGQWLLDQMKRRPQAAVKAYSALSNATRIAMYRSLLPQVRNSAAQKLGFRSFDEIPINNADQLVEKLAKISDNQVVDADSAREFIRQRILKEEVELGDFVNKSTGVLNSLAENGLSKRVMDHQAAASFLLFAPRFFAAQVSLTADILRTGTRGRLARESTARLVAGGLMFYTATSLMLGQTPKLDPRPKKDGGDGGEFLSLEINGTKVSIGGSATALLKFITQQYASLRAGQLGPEFGTPDPDDNTYIRFLKNRLSPIAGVTTDVLSGRTYAGSEIDFGDTPWSWTQQGAEMLGPNLMPFWMQSLQDSGNRGWGTRLAGAGAEFVGFNTYPASPWNVVQELQNQYADSDFGDVFEETEGRRPLWDDLNDFQQRQIELDHPDLRQAEDAAREIYGDRVFSSMQMRINHFTDELAELNEEFNDKYSEMVELMDDIIQDPTSKRVVPGQEFRNERSYLFRVRAEKRDEIYENYDDVLQYFRGETNTDKHIPVFNLVKQLYLDNIVFAEDLDAPGQPGGFNFAERERRIEDFIAIYGEEMYTSIRQLTEMTKTYEHPMEREYRWGRDITKKYWKASEDVIEYLGFDRLREAWNQYNEHLNSPAEADRDFARALKNATPEIRIIEQHTDRVKVELRKQDALMERYLYKYGYLETLENPENIELAREQNILSGGIGMTPLGIPYPPWKLEAIRAAELDNQQGM